jgi:hypothetical protein
MQGDALIPAIHPATADENRVSQRGGIPEKFHDWNSAGTLKNDQR